MYNKLMPFTFFLDMLGFGGKVGRINNLDKAKEFMMFMEGNKQVFKKWEIIDEPNKNIKGKISLSKFYNFNYAFISDSIVMSFVPKEFDEPIDEENYYKDSTTLFYFMVNRIITLQVNLLSMHKIFLRGGISRKFTHIQNEFVVGEGLIEAYNLEHIDAIYPRIILSQELTSDKKFLEGLKFTSNRLYNGDRLIKKDKDKFFYIDFLKYVLSQNNKNKNRDKTFVNLYGREMIEEFYADGKKKVDIVFKLYKEGIEVYYDFVLTRNGKKDYDHHIKKFNWIKEYYNENIKNEYSKYKVNKKIPI